MQNNKDINKEKYDGNEDLVKYLIELGTDINKENENERTLLFIQDFSPASHPWGCPCWTAFQFFCIGSPYLNFSYVTICFVSPHKKLSIHTQPSQTCKKLEKTLQEPYALKTYVLTAMIKPGTANF
ncbi:hypothetical protein H8356DRAFT_1426509 [Neocallimastix lanati (nom. inval.)]|nr:hypothetical protein H8356DRAFT_1426509 [Neocallimastix sp. JGI-2020a]